MLLKSNLPGRESSGHSVIVSCIARDFDEAGLISDRADCNACFSRKEGRSGLPRPMAWLHVSEDVSRRCAAYHAEKPARTQHTSMAERIGRSFLNSRKSSTADVSYRLAQTDPPSYRLPITPLDRAEHALT